LGPCAKQNPPLTTRPRAAFYFAEANLGAIRIDDFKFQFIQQPYDWPGEKATTDIPTIVTLRWDPFDRTPSIHGETLNNSAGGYMNEFRRPSSGALSKCRRITELARTAIEFPPMQAPASFNLSAVNEKIDAAMKNHEGQ
jgi:arylsulfatase